MSNARTRPDRRLALLAVLAAGSATSAQQAASPPGTSPQEHRAPLQRVRIVYDDYAIPHVLGDTDEAAFYGLGYQQALDNPVGTLNLLWLHSGWMARIAGESYLDEDQRIRMWEVPAIARRHEAELREAGLLPLVEAYVQGVNDARDWWRDGNPAASARLDALVGTGFEVWIDPVPDYLNQTFSPFGDFDDPEVPERMRATLNRLFAKEHPITVQHVLRVGVAVNSFFLFRANPVPLDAIPPDDPTAVDPIVPSPSELYGIPSVLQAAKASNGWLLSPGLVTGGGVLTHSDGHLPFNKLHFRPYLVQVRGDRYAATGVTIPGVPVLYSGFNDDFSWLITAPVGDPVARNTWEVTLAPSADPDVLEFPFDLGDGGPPELVRLERVDETLDYHDFETGTLLQETFSRYYVPRHVAEDAGLGFARYPLVPTESPPQPLDTVRFEQAAFTRAGSPWTFLFRMGRARDVAGDLDAIVRGPLMVFGNGHNLLAADSAGHFRYELLAKIPRQGSGVPPSHFSEKAILDGHQLSWRWQGFHEPDEMPSIGPADVSAGREAWINNNVSPDLVETARFTEADLALYPAYMVPQSSFGSWRQLRAEELLRGFAGTVGNGFNVGVGSDVRDTWMHMMWPFFVTAAGAGPQALTVTASDFLAWIEEYRSHGENDTPVPGLDFEAHAYSQVTVYATLLRSHYLDELQKLGPLPVPPPPVADWDSFGIDPLHALFDDPSAFTVVSYPLNVEAMQTAIELVAALWEKGDGPGGLVNQSLLAGWSPGIPGDPWGDPRYARDIEPHWQGTIAGTKTTRWGHLNHAVLTPHFLPPPKRQYVEGVPGNGGDKYAFVHGHTYTGLAPELLATLPYELLKVPFYEGQTVAVHGLRGVKDALFHTTNQPIFYPPAPADYQEAHYGWTPSICWPWQPVTAGSQTLYAAHLRAGQPAQARFLATLTGTEITRVDLLGDGSLAHQRRFANAADFAAGTWRPLVTDRAGLGPPTFVLDYKPQHAVTVPPPGATAAR